MSLDQLGPRSLRQLLEAVLAISAELDLERVLSHIVEAATSLVDARYGALGVLDETGGGLSAFITVGMNEETRARIGELPKGRGLLGALITDAHPLRVPDIAEHEDRFGFPPNHPPMTSFLGVPIMTRGEVFGNLYLTDKQSGEVFTDLDEQLAMGLAAAAGVVIANARLYGQVERRDAALTAINEMVSAVADPRGDEHAALQLVADRARELVGADMATVALPSPDGNSLQVEVVSGPAALELQGRRFPIGGSVSGDVMRSGHHTVLTDVSVDHRTAQPQVQLGRAGPAIWVPLTAYGEPVGTLSVARLRGAAAFRDAEVELVLLFAAQAGVILEVDRGREDGRRLSVLEDQERIARDLHDTVIQRLFATGLTLQGMARLTTEPVTSKIMGAVDDLDATIREIRTVIFGLERATSHATQPGLRSRILDLSGEAARILQFEPTVHFDGPIDTMVDGSLADDVVTVLREATSNIARHAAASHVTISLHTDARTITVDITDDGRGLTSTDDHSGGQGITNMRNRATRRGGHLELASPKGGGTQLTWTAPLTTPDH